MPQLLSLAGRFALGFGAVAVIGCPAASTPPKGEPMPSGIIPSRPTDDGGVRDGSMGDANAIDPLDLSTDLDAIRTKHSLVALSGASYRAGSLVARGVSGVRKKGDETPVTWDDKWHLGSCTKAMTATLVGILIDDGKLKLSDTLGSLLAGTPLDPSFAPVTIEMLLQHRGGFDGDPTPAQWDSMWNDTRAGKAPAETRRRVVLETLARATPKTVGTYNYSNEGYMAVGLVLEELTKKPWETLLSERVFLPLGMSSCGFGSPATRDKIDQPWAHEPGRGGLVPVQPGIDSDNPPSLGPAGTVHCSIADWAKFLAMHVAGAGGTDTLVKAATMKSLHTPPEGGEYAAGRIVANRPWAKGAVLTHAGSNTMFYAVAWLAPKLDSFFVVTTNSGNADAQSGTDAAVGLFIQRLPKN